MQGFIVVCDISNLSSVREVPSWLQQIEARAQVGEGRQVMGLVNKIDTLSLLNPNIDKDTLEIQEATLEQLISTLKKDHPDVCLYEVSTLHGFGLTEAVQEFAQELVANKMLFLRQRFETMLTRQNLIASAEPCPQGGMQMVLLSSISSSANALSTGRIALSTDDSLTPRTLRALKSQVGQAD